MFFQAEDGIRDLVRSRGLGDVYKRQGYWNKDIFSSAGLANAPVEWKEFPELSRKISSFTCLLYTSDAADERSSVDLGGRRIIKKKISIYQSRGHGTLNINLTTIND